MAKSDRRSHDQKRKAKLKKRAERSRKHEPLAYAGNRYKKEEFVMPLFHAEMGIYEAFVLTDRALTDDTVQAALEDFIEELREGTLSPLADAERYDMSDEDEEDMIVWNIRRNWQMLSEEQPLPRKEDLVGILRTILHSLEVWHAKGVLSQGYLRYLEGFMKEAGVSVKVTNEDLEPLPESPPDPLLDLGRRWIEANDRAAGRDFKERIEELLQTGSASRALEVCQQLIGETGESPYLPDLQAMALRGHQRLSERRPWRG